MWKPLEGKRVFLSGPMSSDAHNNVTKFIDAHAVLNRLGALVVYDPACEWVEEIAHGSFEARGHDYYMRRCVRELSRSIDPDGQAPYYDLLVQLDGWRDSRGAKTEKEVAEACGVAVVEFQSLPDVIGGQL